jgi:hypothetical protein
VRGRTFKPWCSTSDKKNPWNATHLQCFYP